MGRIVSNEEYIEYLDKYSKIKDYTYSIQDPTRIYRRSLVDCVCNQCGHEWTTNVDHLLRPSGCQICHYKKWSKASADSRRIPEDIYINDLNEQSKNLNFSFKIDGDHPYTQYTNVHWKCNLCGREFDSRIGALRFKVLGCLYCYGYKYTHAQWLEYLINRCKSLNLDYEIINSTLTDGDLTSSSLIKLTCKDCGNIKIDELGNLHGCRHCYEQSVSYNPGSITEVICRFSVKTIRVRANTEAEFIKICDKNPDFKDLMYEPLHIEYSIWDSIHKYYPDFIVKYKDKVYMIELKGPIHDIDVLRAKNRAATKYCKMHNMKFIFSFDPWNAYERILRDNP